ncbi:MAG: hypothetical protein QOF49_1508 [Chloroflexota bacterium]|jgi:predicted NUDIX family NTP pyrophosphohydrolase|nr:hypothetical protein [Chloroflexota bacterium]
MAIRRSAGILLFRRPADDPAARREVGLEVLLGHPGGPFFVRRDDGHWSIPKGEPDAADAAGATDADDDELLHVARREFAEETGHPAPDTQPDGGPPIALGTIVQKGGKVVHAWAVEGDLDPDRAVSNEFEMEWPPRSGQTRSFPEIDRVAWFSADEARRRLKPAQVPFVDRLVEIVGREPDRT